jgi:nucleoredoxin
LFGNSLCDPQGRLVDVDDVLCNGKYIGIYVGASWASSCVPFCEQLKRSYEKINEKAMLPVFEVVFVSADKSQEDFDNYMREAPWLGVPFSELKLRKKVMTVYGAATLPKFVLLSPSGKVLTDDEKWLRLDPNGAKFPWEGPSDAMCVVQ